MYSDLESDQRKREEVISSLYWSLMQNWDIPISICDHYGFTEDYRLFHQLEELGPDEYKRKRETGEVPDILEVDARLTRTVEKAFESLCGKPPAPYLDKMNEELEKLGQIAALPESVHDIIHISPAFLVKYGIDKTASNSERSCQAEKAYRELDARFVKMTGRCPYADEFFNGIRPVRPVLPEKAQRRKPHITVRPKPKGRKTGL
ncbi:hypothetical protein [Phocaeicola dorei]|uniref:hypothetical protein n=1 Tax=Phocaeicola dorei TaxID=357276 RepID=UPI002165D90A|nr:hypothetical protein [Phocaeicola dorei]MCS2239580.1 hypothetical protein [Phocaeicola dorei]